MIATATVARDGLERLCAKLAVVADLKGTHLVGHSPHVAQVADAAAAGLPDRASLRPAALLHDLGRAAVPSEVWDRPGPLGPPTVSASGCTPTGPTGCCAGAPASSRSPSSPPVITSGATAAATPRRP